MTGVRKKTELHLPGEYPLPPLTRSNAPNAISPRPNANAIAAPTDYSLKNVGNCELFLYLHGRIFTRSALRTGVSVARTQKGNDQRSLF